MWRVFAVLAVIIAAGVGVRSTGPGGGAALQNQPTVGLDEEVVRALAEFAAEEHRRAAEVDTREGPASVPSDSADAVDPAHDATAPTDAPADAPEAEPAAEPEAEDDDEAAPAAPPPSIPTEAAYPVPSPRPEDFDPPAETCVIEGPVALGPSDEIALHDGRVRRNGTWRWEVERPIEALAFGPQGLWAEVGEGDHHELRHLDAEGRATGRRLGPDRLVDLADDGRRLALLTCTRRGTACTLATGAGDGPLQAVGFHASYHHDTTGALDLSGAGVRALIGYQWDVGCGGGDEGLDDFLVRGAGVTPSRATDDKRLAEAFQVAGGSRGWIYVKSETYGDDAATDGLWATRPGHAPVRLTPTAEVTVARAPDGRSAAVAYGGWIWHAEGARRVRRLTRDPRPGIYEGTLAYNGRALLANTEAGLVAWAPGGDWTLVLPGCDRE